MDDARSRIDTTRRSCGPLHAGFTAQISLKFDPWFSPQCLSVLYVKPDAAHRGGGAYDAGAAAREVAGPAALGSLLPAWWALFVPALVCTYRRTAQTQTAGNVTCEHRFFRLRTHARPAPHPVTPFPCLFSVRAQGSPLPAVPRTKYRSAVLRQYKQSAT